MDNRDNRPLREAMEEQYIGWIIGLERVTSVFRMIQILLVLLEWLLPLLEDPVAFGSRPYRLKPRGTG